MRFYNQKPTFIYLAFANQPGSSSNNFDNFDKQISGEIQNEKTETVNPANAALKNYSDSQDSYNKLEKKISVQLDNPEITQIEKKDLGLSLAELEKAKNTKNASIKNHFFETYRKIQNNTFDDISQKEKEENIKEEAFTQGEKGQETQKGLPKTDENNRYTKPVTINENFKKTALDYLGTHDINPETGEKIPKILKFTSADGHSFYARFVQHDATNWQPGSGHWHKLGQKPSDKLDLEQATPANQTVNVAEISEQDIGEVVALMSQEISATTNEKELRESPSYQTLETQLYQETRTDKAISQPQIAEKQSAATSVATKTESKTTNLEEIPQISQMPSMLSEYTNLNQAIHDPEHVVNLTPHTRVPEGKNNQETQQKITSQIIQQYTQEIVYFAQQVQVTRPRTGAETQQLTAKNFAAATQPQPSPSYKEWLATKHTIEILETLNIYTAQRLAQPIAVPEAKSEAKPTETAPKTAGLAATQVLGFDQEIATAQDITAIPEAEILMETNKNLAKLKKQLAYHFENASDQIA